MTGTVEADVREVDVGDDTELTFCLSFGASLADPAVSFVRTVIEVTYGISSSVPTSRVKAQRE